MRNIKFVSAFAVCGFLLSFVFGLFSHTSILSILLKALITGVCFGILGFGIDFVFGHFLAEDTSNDFGGDAAVSSASNSSTGQMVDITIQDEELVPGESHNNFLVGSNHQMLNDSDMKSGHSAASVAPAFTESRAAPMPAVEKTAAVSNSEAADSSSGFVPLAKKETVNNVSGTEAVNPGSTGAPTFSDSSSAASDSGLDTLPDMGSLTLNEEVQSGDDDTDTDTGDEFVKLSHSKGDGEGAEIKDAALMAKAISSVLSNENS